MIRRWKKTAIFSRHSLAKAVLCLLIALLLAEYGVSAEPNEKPSEYEIKATYLYNFGKFVRWPQSANPTFDICILGRDPFGSTIDSLVTGESIDGKPIRVIRLNSAAGAATCRIVFVSDSEEGELGPTLDALAHTQALTVSDMRGFTSHGGMVQFVQQGGRIRFEVNRTAAEAHGLTMSSELLRVAARVIGGPTQ